MKEREGEKEGERDKEREGKTKTDRKKMGSCYLHRRAALSYSFGFSLAQSWFMRAAGH